MNKMRALFKKPGSSHGPTKDSFFNRAGLKARATELQAEIKKVTLEAKAHARRSVDTHRPVAPPENRDPLFQRPKNAPLSEYDKQKAAYDAIENEYRGLHTWSQQLKEKVVAFKHDVHQMKEVHEPSKKMGKADHDLEGLENACLNLDSELAILDKEIAKSKLHVV